VLVEYAREVLGVGEADHAETSPDAETLVVTPLSCSLVGQAHRVRLVAGSRAAALYGSGEAEEDYFCNYGLNPAFRPRLERAGLRATGFDDAGEVRIVELAGHPFFMATLFCFQIRSRAGTPHPLVAGFVDAARSSTRPAV
jgi:CTP synthase (UTP-ammonia lyase)